MLKGEWLYVSEKDAWVKADGSKYIKGIDADPNNIPPVSMESERKWREQTLKLISSVKDKKALEKYLDELSGGVYSEMKKLWEKEEKERKAFWQEVAEIRKNGGRRRRVRTRKQRHKTPPDIKEKVLARDNYTCQKCGCTQNLQVHHIKYRSDGGGDELSNLITLCETCHYKIHRKEPIGGMMKKRIDNRK